ncbi:XRE family transcriptional regulator (plasmid) [Roseomonas mucosa]|nr:XRE family transcriptional regulator [Roseomonas mucosa]
MTGVVRHFHRGRASAAGSPSATFRGERLRLARLFRGLSLEELGGLVAATRQYLHQLETAGRAPTADMVDALAAALDVSPSFFARPLLGAVAPEHCHFRKQATTPQSVVQQVLARGTLLDEVVSAVSAEVELPQVDFPQIPVSDLRGAEAAAEACRDHWGLGRAGPIQNMTRVVEAAGAVVTHFPGLSERVDALSMHRPRPIVVRSSAKDSVMRLRFDLAHECGHLVMHQGVETGDRETEGQAHRFASAFLLPARAFAAEFPRRPHHLDWPGLFAMKRRWGVSVRAIARRAYDLGLIDAAQYRTANVHLARTGQAKGEAGDNDWPWPEEPEVLGAALRALEEGTSGEKRMVAAQLGVSPTLLDELATGVPRLNAKDDRDPVAFDG